MDVGVLAFVVGVIFRWHFHHDMDKAFKRWRAKRYPAAIAIFAFALFFHAAVAPRVEHAVEKFGQPKDGLSRAAQAVLMGSDLLADEYLREMMREPTVRMSEH